jgi:hypothetical protein
MENYEHDTKITVLDLQRNAAAVIKRLEHGETVTVTRHGRIVPRTLLRKRSIRPFPTD